MGIYQANKFSGRLLAMTFKWMRLPRRHYMQINRWTLFTASRNDALVGKPHPIPLQKERGKPFDRLRMTPFDRLRMTPFDRLRVT